MDQTEKDLLEKYKDTNPELKALWEDHVLFSNQVNKLADKPYRTPSEEQTLRQLKKQKLDNKTKMIDLIERLKKEQS